MSKNLLKQHKSLISLDDPKVQRELKAYEKFIEENKQQIARKIVLNAIYQLKVEQPIIHCSKRIDLSTLPNYTPEIIGHLLGQQGCHKEFFVNLTGVDLNIEKNSSNAIVLSKYNTIKVEKATELIKKILARTKKGSPMWNENKINQLYNEVNVEWDENCKTEGKKILKEYLEYDDDQLTDELCIHVGQLRHIYSFSQNILEHSLEVAQISANIASQLDLNPLKAKRAGFFHDIGKAITNLEDHVDKGVNIAVKAKLDSFIVNAIASHHRKPDGVRPNNPYSMIVYAADKLSASRDGARPRQIELIEQRMEMIKEEVKKMDWVEKVVVKNAGNSIEVLVKRSQDLSNEKLNDMKTELKYRLNSIRDEYSYNFNISLQILHEESMSVSVDRDRMLEEVVKLHWVEKAKIQGEGSLMDVFAKRMKGMTPEKIRDFKREVKEKIDGVKSDKSCDIEIRVHVMIEDKFNLDDSTSATTETKPTEA